MTEGKLKVGFAGARWLGVNCLKYIKSNKDVEITHVCFPQKSEKVWWKDVADHEEVEKMGYKITPWEKWKNLKFDLIFSVLHGGIFKKDHLDRSKFGIVNLHPAPLPEYRGCNSYAHAIMNGDKYYRVSLHYVNEGIDNGPVVGQNTIKILDSDTGFSLYEKAQTSALGLFKEHANSIIADAKKGEKYPSRKQDESKAKYYKRDSLSNKEAHLSWEAKKLINFVRALDFPPFEPAFIILNGKKIYLTLNQR